MLNLWIQISLIDNILLINLFFFLGLSKRFKETRVNVNILLYISGTRISQMLQTYHIPKKLTVYIRNNKCKYYKNSSTTLVRFPVFQSL